ncbi:MAG: hypothetical protein ACRC5T_10975 [Cetobacterium sp.]
MAKFYCKECNLLVKKNKQGECEKCGTKELKYIGTCGECMEFDELYDSVGVCNYKSKLNRFQKGCEKFI